MPMPSPLATDIFDVAVVGAGVVGWARGAKIRCVGGSIMKAGSKAPGNGKTTCV